MNLSFSLKVKQNDFLLVGSRGASAMASALVQEAEETMTDAKALTPVATGALRASGHALPPVVVGTSAAVVLTFGGAASKYALIVHEDMQARHPVGQAKFLETAVLRRAPGISGRMRKRISAGLGVK